MSMEGWWMVQTTVLPVLTVLRTVRMTMAAARASKPEVGCSRAGKVSTPEVGCSKAGTVSMPGVQMLHIKLNFAFCRFTVGM